MQTQNTEKARFWIGVVVAVCGAMATVACGVIIFAAKASDVFIGTQVDARPFWVTGGIFLGVTGFGLYLIFSSNYYRVHSPQWNVASFDDQIEDPA